MGMTPFLFTTATGAAGLAETLAPANTIVFYGFKLHLDIAGGLAEAFTVTSDAIAGAVYDTLIYSQDMNAVTDIVEMFDTPIPFYIGDELDFAWTNTNTRTWGLEIIYRHDV